ncbi:hypothetical protein D3C80_1770440 [compost metagenome]
MLMRLMTTQRIQFSTYLRVIRIWAITESTVMQASQNGKASGEGSGMARLAPNRLSSETEVRARAANTGSMKRVSRAMAMTLTSAVSSSLDLLSQRICKVSPCSLAGRVQAYQP